MEEEERKFPRIPKSFNEKATETCKTMIASKLYPLPTSIRIDQDASSGSEAESESDEEDKNSTSSKLDKWDKGARGWLSSGTMFLLIVLFHVIQVRSDLRRFTSAANIQLHEACSVLEDKTMTLQTALSLAAQDVGPISFKFVRDLKTKIRGAFHFAGQIFGGRVREALVSLFKKYYCLLVGALVAFKSFSTAVTELLLNIAQADFVTSILEAIQKTIDKITEFVTEPDKAFADLFTAIMDEIFDATLTHIILPNLGCESMADVCSAVKTLDFSEIDRLLKGYMAKIIALIAILLVLYNTFKFALVLVINEPKEPDDEREYSDSDNDNSDSDNGNSDSENSENDDDTESGRLMNAFKWLCNFFSYQPFWIFLSMGVFGVLHLHFSRSLELKAQQMKANIIDPAIDQLKDDFTRGLQGYLVRMEEGWSQAFRDLIRPITDFVAKLAELFKPILTVIVDLGKEILKFIEGVLAWIDSVTIEDSISKTVAAILDCFMLKNFRCWLAIATIINDKLFGGNWNTFQGGILGLLQKSIQSVFEKLQVTKYLKKLLSVHFMMFLKLMTKRSVFLYVYLIVCAILIGQGLLMLLIKFLLGYF